MAAAAREMGDGGGGQDGDGCGLFDGKHGTAACLTNLSLKFSLNLSSAKSILPSVDQRSDDVDTAPSSVQYRVP